MDHKFTLVFPKNRSERVDNELISSISILLFSIISKSPTTKHFIVNKVHSGGESLNWNDLNLETNRLLEENLVINKKNINRLSLRSSPPPTKTSTTSWQETFTSFDQNDSVYNAVINLLDEDKIHWFDVYVSDVIKDCTHIEINCHSDCKQLFEYIDDTGSFGHLIINSCDNESYIEALRRTRYYESICLIKEKEKKSRKICRFDFQKEILEITKYKGIPSIEPWSKIHLSKNRYFISYSSKDDYSYIINDIRKCINRYFPFINVETDKDIDNQFRNINLYVKELIEGNGNFVFYLIGKNYLKSFYSTYELLMTFEKYNLLGRSEEELKAGHLIENLMLSGRFILIESAFIAKKIRSVSNTDLISHWELELKKSKSDREFTQEQVQKVVDNIENIKKIISCLNTSKYLHHYYFERYKSLVKPISSALGEVNSFFNLYEDYSPDNIESLTGFEGFEVNPYVYRSLKAKR